MARWVTLWTIPQWHLTDDNNCDMYILVLFKDSIRKMWMALNAQGIKVSIFCGCECCQVCTTNLPVLVPATPPNSFYHYSKSVGKKER